MFQFIRQANQYFSKGKAKQKQMKFITAEDMILFSVIYTVRSNDRTYIHSYLHWRSWKYLQWNFMGLGG